MSLARTKGTMQRRASAVCNLQNTSTVSTAVDAETFEPQNMAYTWDTCYDTCCITAKYNISKSVTMETTEFTLASVVRYDLSFRDLKSVTLNPE